MSIGQVWGGCSQRVGGVWPGVGGGGCHGQAVGPTLGELLGGGVCIHSKRNSDMRWGWVVCRDVSRLYQVGDSREEGPGSLGTMCFLNKGSFPLSVLPLGSEYEQRDGTGREEVIAGGHLPGLVVTDTQRGSSSLASPQALHLHLAQPISALGKAKSPHKGSKRAR